MNTESFAVALSEIYAADAIAAHSSGSSNQNVLPLPVGRMRLKSALSPDEDMHQ